jgi:inorganic pyrophosphatase/exopolyphosphatase
LGAMKVHKQENNMDIFFLAVVNIVALHSNMLILGPDELNLCQTAFPATDGTVQTAEDGLYYMGGRVSRKKDYVPFITKTINKGGWVMPSSKA